MTLILNATHQVYKLSQLKMQTGTKDAQVALGLLTALGAIKKVLWKADRCTGYPAAYILKNTTFESAARSAGVLLLI